MACFVRPLPQWRDRCIRVRCTGIGRPPGGQQAPAFPRDIVGKRSHSPAFVDYLQLTVNALDDTYQAVATVVNLNIPGNLPIPGIPFKINGADAVLSVVDRDVILARSDIEAIPVDYTVFQALGFV